MACPTYWVAAGAGRVSTADAAAALLVQSHTPDWRRKASGRYFQPWGGAEGVDSLQAAWTSGRVFPRAGATCHWGNDPEDQVLGGVPAQKRGHNQTPDQLQRTLVGKVAEIFL